MSDRLFLANSLTLTTTRSPTGLVTTLRSGGRPIPATPELLEAALRLVGGAPLREGERERLLQAGILAPRNPFRDGMPRALALREDVGLRLELKPAQARLPGLQDQAFGPTQRFYESLCVPAVRLAPLLAFHHRLLHTWSHLVTREDGPAALGRIAQRLLEQDLNLQAVIQDEGRPGAPHFTPLVPLQEPEPQLEILGLHLQRGDLEPVRLRVRTWADLPDALRPLRRLAAGVEGAELQRATSPDMVAAVREWLAEDLLFEPPKAEFQLHPGFAIHLGHGTLMSCLAGKNLLLDPWIPEAPPGPGPIPLPRFALPPLDAVLLTGLDQDLADVQTMMLLPEDTPIYLPRQAAGSALLRALGFERVHEVDPGEVIDLDGVRLQAVPVGHPAGVGWALHDGDRGFLALGRHTDPALDGLPGNLSPVFTSRIRSDAPRLMLGWPVLLEPFARWFEAALPAPDPTRLAAALEPAEIVLYCEGGGRWHDRRTPAIRRDPDPASAPLAPLWPTPEEIARVCQRPTRVARPYDVFAVGGSFDRSVVAAFTRR